MSQLIKFEFSQLKEVTGNFHPCFLIGQGGFGKVYRAMIDLKPVAIKRWDRDGLQGDAEFQTEKRMGIDLMHPYIVRLLGYAEENVSQPSRSGIAAQKNTCLVYELLSNGNLEEHLAPGRPLPWVTRIHVIAQVSCALEFMHQQRIVHCDLKPSNIFLDCSMNSKLGDVGMALRLPDASTSSAPTPADGASRRQGQGEMLLKGTWEYLAPEYTSDGKNTFASDVYSLGVIMLQLVTGAHSANDGAIGREVGLQGKGGIGLGGGTSNVAPPRRELRYLVQECRLSLSQGRIEEIIDYQYGGAWDAAVAQRLVKLGLWCCYHEASRRPSAALIATEVSRLLEIVPHQP